MVRRCEVCRQLNIKGSGRSFHRFPQATSTLRLWLSSLNIVKGSINLKQGRICSDHFSSQDFVVKQSGVKYLSPSAVPVLSGISGIRITGLNSGASSASVESVISGGFIQPNVQRQLSFYHNQDHSYSKMQLENVNISSFAKDDSDKEKKKRNLEENDETPLPTSTVLLPVGCKQWAIACDRLDWFSCTQGAGFSMLKSYYRVCSMHFEDKMFSNVNKNRLKPDATPTLFLKKCAPSGERCKEAERSNPVESSVSSPLETTDIKIEESELSETEESDQSYAPGPSTRDPLIKVDYEGPFSSITDYCDPLEMLPETSVEPPAEAPPQVKTYRNFNYKVYCRLCFKPTVKNTQLPLGELDLNYPDKSDVFKQNKKRKMDEVLAMINFCLPFYEPLAFNPIVCANCVMRLKSCYEFTLQCKQNQQLIKDYVNANGITEKVVNLNDVIASSKNKLQNVPKPSNKTENTSSRVIRRSNLESVDISSPLIAHKRTAEKEVEHNYATTSKKQKVTPDAREESPGPNERLIKEEVQEYSPQDLQQTEDSINPPIKVELNYVDTPEYIKTEPEEDSQFSETGNTTSSMTSAGNCVILLADPNNRELINKEPDRGMGSSKKEDVRTYGRAMGTKANVSTNDT